MDDYKAMYCRIFNAVTDAEQQLRQISATLRKAQQECEEMYIAADEADDKTE